MRLTVSHGSEVVAIEMYREGLAQPAGEGLGKTFAAKP